jgi:hypothetical protein
MSDANQLNFSVRAKAMSSFLRVGLYYRRWAEGRQEGVEWSMINSTRGDKHYGSFKLNTETLVWCDFASDAKGADLVDLYAYLKSLSLNDALLELEAQHGRKDGQVESSSRNSVKAKEDSDSGAAEDWAVAPSRCTDFHDREGRAPTFVADYYNREGQLIGHVARYDGKKLGDKEYKPWTWVNAQWRCSKGGWKKTPIFGVEKLIGNDNPVLIVEGEKCALEAQRVLGSDWNVLSWPGGVRQASTADWTILSGNQRVYLWPDDDLDQKCYGHGLKAMGEIRTLIGSGTILDPHPLNKQQMSGWDIADGIAEGWEKSRLVEFITRPPVVADQTPKPAPVEIPAELETITSWILKVANEKHELFAVQAAFVLLASLTMGAYETPTYGSVGIYSLLISGASGGKAAYVDKVMSIARKLAPYALAAEPGSRQALRADMSIRKSNCITIYNGELGVGLARILVENGIGSQISQDLLDCWGSVDFLEGLPTKEGKDPDVIEPRLSLYGGTTMSTFEELLSRKGAVSGGFISRLDPIVSTYIDLDDEDDACAEPFPEASMQWLERIANAMTAQQKVVSNMATMEGLLAVRVKKKKTVSFTIGAHKLYKEYKSYCRARKAKYQLKNKVLADIYGRCYEKSVRYASLLAIAANPDSPEITQRNYEYGREWVERFTSELIAIAFVHGNSSTHARIRAAALRYLLKSNAGTTTLRDLRNNTLLRNEDVSVVKQIISSMVDDGLIEQKVVGKSVILGLTSDGRKDAEI